MHHPVHAVKSLIKSQMCRQIRGGAQAAFDGLPIQVGEDEIFGRHGVVRHAARFNDNLTGSAVKAAGVSKCEYDQPFADQFAIGFKDFFP